MPDLRSGIRIKSRTGRHFTGKLETMSVLSVEVAGLQTLAGISKSTSAAFAANAATSAKPATTFQPSAAAVAGYGDD